MNLFWASFLLPKPSCIFSKVKTNAEVHVLGYFCSELTIYGFSFQKQNKEVMYSLTLLLETFLGKNEQFVIRILLSNLQVLLQDYNW